MRISDTLQKSWVELQELLSTLHRDTMDSFKELKRISGVCDIGQLDLLQFRFWQKATIRCLFGQMDALSFAMRYAVVRSWRDQGLNLSARTLARLQEQRYDIDSDSITQERAWNSFEKNFKMSFKHFPALFGADYDLNTSAEEWRTLKRFVVARNRLTHPKTIEDLLPLDAIHCFRPCFLWFHRETSALLAACGQSMSLEIELPEKEMDVPFLVSADSSSPDGKLEAAVFSNTYFFLKYMQVVGLEYEREMDVATQFLKDSLGSRRSANLSRFALRAFVRAAVVAMEATTSILVEFLKEGERSGAVSFSETERYAIFHERVFFEHFIVTHEIFSREFGLDISVERANINAGYFRDVIEFRDRLTHPKSASDIDPISLSYNNIIKGVLWGWGFRKRSLRASTVKVESREMARSGV